MVLQLTNNVKDVNITTGLIKNSLDAASILDELNDSIEATLAAREKINHDTVTEYATQFVPPPPVVISVAEKLPDIGPIGGGTNLDMDNYGEDLDGAEDLKRGGGSDGSGSGDGEGDSEGSDGSGGGKSAVGGFMTFVKILIFILLIAVVIIAYKNRDKIKQQVDAQRTSRPPVVVMPPASSQ